MDIPIYYDPMISKLIVHAEDRSLAIAKMIRAIDDYKIIGIKTTLDFCRFALNHDAFVSGNFDTKFVEKYFTPSNLDSSFDQDEVKLLAALGVYFLESDKSVPKIEEHAKSGGESAWRRRLD